LANRFIAWEVEGDSAAARTLDAAGAFLAGSATGEGRSIGGHAVDWDPGLPGTLTRFVATVRMTELDDIHMPSCTTPGSVVVATAVIVGAQLDVDPARFRRAVEVGYEAMARIGTAIAGATVVYRGVWPTYFGAPFAAAAVVASLLDLDARRTADALGLALTRSTGLSSGIDGSPLGRWLCLGDAARAGCSAAFAARDGFVSDIDLHRVAAATGLNINMAALHEEVPPAVRDVSVKPFPAAKQSLAATEAALRLRDRANRSAVRVCVPEHYVGMVAPMPRGTSRLSRISSVPWNVALALARPSELHDVERATTVDDPELSRIAGQVEVVADSDLSRLYPAQWPARVETGAVSETVVDTTGDPSTGNGFQAVDEKWRQRPEDAGQVRAAALAGTASRLLDLLS
jgi:2-methylcitrate dehydratase PrpD